MLHSLLFLATTAGKRGLQRLPLLLGALLLMAGTQAAKAQQTGIFQTTVRIDGFDRAGGLNAGNTTPYEGATLGAGGYSPGNASLILDGAEVRTFKNSGGDVTAATLFYRVYLQGSATRGSTTPAYTAVNLPFGANLGTCNNSGCDQRWTLTGANINLTAGLTTRGTYVVEVYWRASTNLGDRFDSNSGNNFVATFGFAGSPLCGTYTLDYSRAVSADNFTSFATAFNSLNTAGVSCATTFNVRDNLIYPENNVQLNAVAGASTTTRVTFQRDNSTASGSNVRPVVRPNLIASGSGGAQDAIIKLSGADFITFDGIDVSDANNAGVSAVRQMEYGYALFRPSATDGCQNNIIRNCAVTLNKTNSGSIGIYGANANISGTAQTATNATGANSDNEFDGNTIANSYLGFSLNGNNTAGSFPDLNNRVGSTLGNTVSNIGGSISTDVFGIRADYQSGLRIENNTINIPSGNTSASIRGIATGISSSTGMVGTLLIAGNTVTISTASTGNIFGIQQGGGGNLDNVTISNNRVQNSALTATGNTVTYILDASSNGTTPQTVTITGNVITGNSSATGSAISGIYRAGARAAAVTISSNQITNNIGSGTGQFYGVRVDAANPTSTPVMVSSNTVSGTQLTGTFGRFYGASLSSGTLTFASNTISNNAIPNTAGTSDISEAYGYFQNGTTVPSETLTDNVITGLSIGGTSTATSHVVQGIASNGGSSATVQTYLRNVVGNLSIGGSGSVVGVALLQGGGAGTTVARNKLYDLSVAGATGTVAGIAQTGGGTFTYANNLLGDFRAPAASNASAVMGLSLTGGTAANVYFNTVYLNASSTGGTFGTAGVQLGTTAPLVTLRNNVVANLSTPNGSGTTAALRRNGANTTNSNFGTATNNNLYWAGTPSAANVLFTDGTVTAQDLPAYKLLLAPKEADSFTENPPFISTTGTSADFLHIKPNFGTQIESGGKPIAGFTDDFDGDTRNATAPDLGADEGTFRLGPPLPVELSAFEAARQGDGAALTWTTASEKNSRGFEVQLSTDGHTFRTLGFVAGAGNSSTPHRYAYLDRETDKTGLRYYRLRQLDADGTASFSPVRVLDFGLAAGATLQAAPQPFGNELVLTVQAPQAQPDALLTLIDATGRRVLTRQVGLVAGPNQVSLCELAAVPAGVYVLQVALPGRLVRLRVVKQ
ncbi:hypothetical protein Q5H92_20745 [Hymenobacter sp. M29]|uniref:Secretion system C-terminal sorting domain-containing protein n=1 Tax=Hymenobacter mellowenesis TaxID=3063995 RepID=A0ABT9AG29_9BACT|nr:hypothetical protein [Hymenobacter sp. M29]MDO7848806.1 hypothetical protein [Hymenobacter sp. M29]